MSHQCTTVLKSDGRHVDSNRSAIHQRRRRLGARLPQLRRPPSGRFCAECGQNDRDYRRSTWSVMGDALREIFEVDSKVFRTLKLLIRPGRLSAEFSRNRRANYVSPVRLYLFASIIFLFATTQGQLIGGSSETVETGQQSPASEGVDTTQGSSVTSMVGEAQIDYLIALLPPESARKLDQLLSRPDGRKVFEALLLITGDLSARDPDEASGLERALWNGIIAFLYDPGLFQARITGNLSIGAVFFVPVPALLLALVNHRKKRYFAEHLVFQMHLQTFSFLASSVLLLLPEGSLGYWARLIAGGGVLFYSVAAMRHFYEDSWGHTVLKVFILIVLYGMLVTPVLFATLLLSM